MSIKRRAFIRKMTFTGMGAAGLAAIPAARAGDNPLAPEHPAAPTGIRPASAPFVNVKEFGARGDGRSDDRIAVQDAIDSIRESGGTVFLPPGIYRLSLNPNERLGIKVHSNMQIIGAGRGNTALKWLDDVATDGQHYLLAAAGGFVENVTIADFEIDGNRRNRGDATFQIRGEGIEMDGKNICIRNMHIHDVLGEGIDCDHSDGYFITNVIVENTGGNGIHCSDARVRNVMISNCITRNCAHGRRDSGNVRYGGLVLRGSDIHVDHHLSIGDAQIASIEGQGRGEQSEILLIGVTGRSESEVAEGFRVGMQGRLVLSHCRSDLPNSIRDNFRAAGFEGALALAGCHAETGDGIPYSISMKGTLTIENCTAKSHPGRNPNHGYNLRVNGRAILRNSTNASSPTGGNESAANGPAAAYIGPDNSSERTEATITGNHLEGAANALHLSGGVAKGFVSGNVCDRNILLEGDRITCINNVVPQVINQGSHNTVEPNYPPGSG